MNQRSDRRCPTCGNELSPTEVTRCGRCGQALMSSGSPPFPGTTHMFPGATPGAAQRQGPKLTVPLAPTIRAAIRRSSWQQCVFLGLAGVLVVLLCLLVIIVALASVKPSQNPHATAQG
ncbi:MAG TPA: hypothetical protein VKX46_12020, partial [Ktedonobacteraceae bacterium]|nr:hypothetical protein [Ktedonobacteraceae bacterium]